MKRQDVWGKVARWGGRSLSTTQIELLDRYRDWLITEARAAGGIGPSEPERVDTRHIADSLLFAAGLGENPGTVADLGSGVGLPGIPLAILMPGTAFRLFDRSSGRIDMMRRAVRILDLPNVEVVAGEIARLEPSSFPALVSRATLTPTRAAGQFRRLLQPDGVGVLGGSWLEPPLHPGWETMTVPAKILDREVWILIMRRRE